MLKVEAKYSSAFAKKASGEFVQGVQRDFPFVQRAKIMFTRNLWTEVELVKGIRWEAVDIVWGPEQKAPALPEFVVVQLEGYRGPA